MSSNCRVAGLRVSLDSSVLALCVECWIPLLRFFMQVFSIYFHAHIMLSSYVINIQSIFKARSFPERFKTIVLACLSRLAIEMKSPF